MGLDNFQEDEENDEAEQSTDNEGSEDLSRLREIMIKQDKRIEELEQQLKRMQERLDEWGIIIEEVLEKEYNE